MFCSTLSTKNLLRLSLVVISVAPVSAPSAFAARKEILPLTQTDERTLDVEVKIHSGDREFLTGKARLQEIYVFLIYPSGKEILLRDIVSGATTGDISKFPPRAFFRTVSVPERPGMEMRVDVRFRYPNDPPAAGTREFSGTRTIGLGRETLAIIDLDVFPSR